MFLGIESCGDLQERIRFEDTGCGGSIRKLRQTQMERGERCMRPVSFSHELGDLLDRRIDRRRVDGLAVGDREESVEL